VNAKEYAQEIPTLYRGVTSPIAAEGQHELIREDRRPRDSGKDLPFNICFNLMIEHRFGVPLIRQRALFVSGDARTVVKYAAQNDTEHIGLVKPVGSFRFLYSPRIRGSFSPYSAARVLARHYRSCFSGIQAARCRPLLDNISLTLAQLEQFFADNPGVDKGIPMRGGLSLRKRVYRVLDTDLGYTIDDLGAGARSGVEIMLFDCPGGYRLERIEESQLPLLRKHGR